jgi:transposase
MGVPYRKAKRWVEVWRETGTIGPRKHGYRSKLDDHEDFLRKLVADHPTIKLAEIHDALEKRGVKASRSAVWNALTRFGIRLATHGLPTTRRSPDESANPEEPGKEPE